MDGNGIWSGKRTCLNDEKNNISSTEDGNGNYLPPVLIVNHLDSEVEHVMDLVERYTIF